MFLWPGGSPLPKETCSVDPQTLQHRAAPRGHGDCVRVGCSVPGVLQASLGPHPTSHPCLTQITGPPPKCTPSRALPQAEREPGSWGAGEPGSWGRAGLCRRWTLNVTFLTMCQNQQPTLHTSEVRGKLHINCIISQITRQ